MAHILFKVGVKRTQFISGIFMKSSCLKFNSSASKKAIYIKPEEAGIPDASD